MAFAIVITVNGPPSVRPRYNFQARCREQLCITPIRAVTHMSVATEEFSLLHSVLSSTSLPPTVILSLAIVAVLVTDR